MEKVIYLFEVSRIKLIVSLQNDLQLIFGFANISRERKKRGKKDQQPREIP